MSRRIEIGTTGLEGLSVLQRKPIGDHRGYLERLFCDEELDEILRGRAIRQINRTYTAEAGTVRGLHFQAQPYAEMKIVSCLQGEVFDVAVDLRRDSSTFLQWHGEILSGTNGRTFAIPEGFAHGFQTLTADCLMLYLHTAPFQASAERGLNALDPELGIKWPLTARNLSPRDMAHPVSAEISGIL